jgi:hypothetical protein
MPAVREFDLNAGSGSGIIERMAALASAPPLLTNRQPGWIYKPSWDLPLIIFSAVLVPLPFLVAWLAQTTGWLNPEKTIDMINISVALLIGGPHLFSTITYTFLDGRFRSRHKGYLAMAFILPAIVIYLGVYYYTALITFFFTWASIHVLHQVIYLTDCYRARSAFAEEKEKWSRLIDYGVVMTALYPIGMYKMSLRLFQVGGVVLPYPDFVRPFHLPEIAGVVFAICLVAWVYKTIGEFRDHHGNIPKTLLIGITTAVSFLLPLGSNLDVLFQGYNTWHSFQYLFLLWLINRLRDQRGEIENPFVQRMVRQKSMVLYYLCFLGATGLIVVVTMLVRALTTLRADQSYFIVVLSVLLMHYYFDHFLFSHTQMVE